MNEGMICPTCEGEGYEFVYIDRGDHTDIDTKKCERCEGTGRVAPYGIDEQP